MAAPGSRTTVGRRLLCLSGSIAFPLHFSHPLAPHIAAEMAGVEMHLEEMVDTFDVLATWADAVVVDGVGGFRVPLGADFDTADLASTLNLPVVIVVGIKMGCMNHALLTAEVLRARGLHLAGWVANMIDHDLPEAQRYVAALRLRMGAPCLAQIPYIGSPQIAAVAASFSIDTVLAALSS
ncbi:dethiobiotin synthase [Polaromonas sp. P2-4]|nr:dethiobiotin synthase [Polaromonas sp. P2-4]